MQHVPSDGRSRGPSRLRYCGDSPWSRSRRRDRTSLTDFAEISRLKLDHRRPIDASGPLKTDQHLLDRIEIDVITRKSGDVMRQVIRCGRLVRNMMLLGQLLNVEGGR